MAPRHPEMMGRNSIRDASSAFDEDPFAIDAFDPFDTSDTAGGGDFGDSFACDFDEIEFPDTSDGPSGSKVKTGSRTSSVRKSSSAGVRSKRSERGMGDSSSRLVDRSSRMDSSSRMLDNSSRMLDSSSRMMDSSSRLDDSGRLDGSSSKRRTRMRDQRTPKPTRLPSFPKNTSRRSLHAKPPSSRSLPGVNGEVNSSRLSRRSSTSDLSSPLSPVRSERPVVRSVATRASTSDLAPKSPRVERSVARPTATKSKSRRSLTVQEDAPPSPEGGTASKRLSSSARHQNVSPKSPRPTTGKGSRRETLPATDARSRIRKEAALQRERELREQEEAKIAAQKAKLAKQKEKTSQLLGRKLANLDAKEQLDHNDHHNMMNGGPKSPKSINTSMHSNGARSAVNGRRRRTHLSHNILVRNMNHMTTPKLDDDDHFDEQDETEYGDQLDEDISIFSDDNGKKEAWQRRRERQSRS